MWKVLIIERKKYFKSVKPELWKENDMNCASLNLLIKSNDYNMSPYPVNMAHAVLF